METEQTLAERQVALLETIKTLLVWLAIVVTVGVVGWLAWTFGR